MSRLKRHPENRSLFFVVIVSVSVVFVMTAGLGVYLAFFTDMFRVRYVEVTGNRRLSSGYIRDLAGICYDENLLTVPTSRIKENVETDPWVLKADIGRKLFHTVTVYVSERKPVAVIDCGGVGFLIDSKGHVITTSSPDQYAHLPLVNGGDTPTPIPDARIGDKRLKECVAIIGSMPDALRDSIATADPFDGRGQIFGSRNGYRIIYGSNSDLKEKNELLEAIMVEIASAGRDVAYVDIRVPDSPVIKVD